MSRHAHWTVITPFVATLGITLIATQVVLADDDAWIGVVTHENVAVHCGGARSYYPMAMATTGDLVQVTGEKFKWARVAAVGALFESEYGYVRYAFSDGPQRLRLSDDGTTATILGPTRVLARNLNTPELSHSWRPACVLGTDTVIEVLETTTIDADDPRQATMVVHHVRLPAEAHGWINTAYLRRATTPEVERWDAWFAGGGIADAQPLMARVETTAAPPNVVEAPTPPPTPVITPIETEAPPPVAAPPGRLDDLEAAWARMLEESILAAEVAPLRALYLELADGATDPVTVSFAAGRAEQLAIWADLQGQRARIDGLQHRARSGSEAVTAARTYMETTGAYAAAGRLDHSSVFSGAGLPLLYRVRDVASGRTVTYVRPADSMALDALVGQHVGIVGETGWDDSLGVSVIEPSRADILTPDHAALRLP